MTRPMLMNRREAALSFGALWTTLVIPGQAAAQATTLTWTPKALTPAQARTLDVAAELIMPKTDTPGAREAGVPAFVDQAVGTYCAPADARAIRDGLDRMDADARAAHGAGFGGLTSEQQTALLSRYDAERPPFFPVLKELVTVGYFTSRLGATRAVRYDPVPGAYRGCVPLSQIGRAWAQ